MNRPRPPDPELAAMAEAPLSRDEFRRRLAIALEELNGPERENIDALITWFMRRYPTPSDRLRYNARKMRERG